MSKKIVMRHTKRVYLYPPDLFNPQPTVHIIPDIPKKRNMKIIKLVTIFGAGLSNIDPMNKLYNPKTMRKKVLNIHHPK